jgi:hypothetical protein
VKIQFVAHFLKDSGSTPHPIFTLPENVFLLFAVMPAKSNTSPKQDLYPRITGTLSCKWDISAKGKVFLHDRRRYPADGVLSGGVDLEI